MKINTSTMISKQSGETIVQPKGTIGRNQLQIDNLKNCTVYVFECCGSVVVDDCVDCSFFFGPITGSIMVRDCTGGSIHATCQQFRTRGCQNIALHLFSLTDPTIESSHLLTFSPLSVAIPRAETMCVESKMNFGDSSSTVVNKYDRIFDFDKANTAIPSPHFTVLDKSVVQFITVYDLIDEFGVLWKGEFPKIYQSSLPPDVPKSPDRVVIDCSKKNPEEKKKEKSKGNDVKVSSTSNSSATTTATTATATTATSAELPDTAKWIKCVVEWYNQRRGFGIANTQEEPSRDVKIYRKSLPRRNAIHLKPSAEIEVQCATDSEGQLRATKILASEPTTEVQHQVGKEEKTKNSEGSKDSDATFAAEGLAMSYIKRSPNEISNKSAASFNERRSDNVDTKTSGTAATTESTTSVGGRGARANRRRKVSGKDEGFTQQELSVEKGLLPGTTTTKVEPMSPESQKKPTHVTIRHYAEEDHPRFKTFLMEANMYIKSLDNRQVLRKQIEFDPTSIIVAEDDGVIIGTVYTLYNPWQAFIYHLCVHPNHRSKGVANMLMDKAEAQLKARGIHCPTLFVESGNETVSKFYERRGWFRTDPCLCLGKDL